MMNSRKQRLIQHSLMMLSWYASQLLHILPMLFVNLFLYFFASILPKRSLGLKHRWIYEGNYKNALESSYTLPKTIVGVLIHLFKIMVNKATTTAPYVIYHSKVQRTRKMIGSIGKLHHSVNSIPNGNFYWNAIINLLKK